MLRLIPRIGLGASYVFAWRKLLARGRLQPPRPPADAQFFPLFFGGQPMARPQLSEQDRRSKKIVISFSPGEYRALQEAAKKYRRPIAVLARQLILNGEIDFVPECNFEAYRQLCKIGGNLNQIAKHLNQGGSPQEIRDYLHKILELLEKSTRELTQ